MVFPYSPKKHKNGITCKLFKEEHYNCKKEELACGAYKLLAGVRHE